MSLNILSLNILNSFRELRSGKLLTGLCFNLLKFRNGHAEGGVGCRVLKQE
jgi:hypothetical protein